MDANLRAEHGLTINDYEVLLALSGAPERRMRRVDLADHVLLTQSGMTRLLHGLEEAGLVCRADCPTDRRVVYAELTDAGHERLRAAARTHVRDIEELFAARLSGEELATLEGILERFVGAADGEACEA
jgi:DNA-binding MarR family transcriptional regulator